MRRTSSIAIIAAVLALAACASDGGSGSELSNSDGDSGSELSEAQAAAAQSAIDSAAEDGVTLDESCVNEVAAQLSDEDAVLAAADADAELSAEGEAAGLELLSCADEGEIIDLFVAGLTESGSRFDEACVRQKIEEFGVENLLSSAGEAEAPPAFAAAITECIDG